MSAHQHCHFQNEFTINLTNIKSFLHLQNKLKLKNQNYNFLKNKISSHQILKFVVKTTI